MPLNTNWFKNLIPYFQFAKKALWEENIFFVGWIIRDIFLNIRKDNFQDVDITLAKNPQKLYEQIDKNSWSIFRTDKFWTVTIVDKLKNCQYETTPFRKEWNYSDCRHPDELEWTDDILEDSIRRDFTINCLYYTFIDSGKDIILEKQDFKDEEKLIKQLKNNWFAIISDNIVIIKDENIIKKFLKDGKIHKDILKKFIWDFWKLHVIIDPNFWIQDLLNQKIKAVWNPDDRIKEDALRIIRAIRFVSVLNMYENINLNFDSKTWLALKKYYFLIRKIAKERIVKEMKKVFINWNSFWFVALLDELNILKYLFPHLYDLKHIDQPTRYHPFDCYAHTILTLHHLQKINNNYLVRFGMLYHDVGKKDQYYWASIKKDEESQNELYKLEINHPIIGAEMAKEDFQRLWFSKKEVEEISFYVLYHMFPWELDSMSEKKKEKEIKKFISKYWLERLLNLCDITIWDRKWQYNPLQHSNLDSIVELKDKINRIYKETWRITLKELKVNWNDIINIFWKAWSEVGVILDKLLEFVLEDEKRNDKKILLQKAEQLVKKLKDKN